MLYHMCKPVVHRPGNKATVEAATAIAATMDSLVNATRTKGPVDML